MNNFMSLEKGSAVLIDMYRKVGLLITIMYYLWCIYIVRILIDWSELIISEQHNVPTEHSSKNAFCDIQ